MADSTATEEAVLEESKQATGSPHRPRYERPSPKISVVTKILLISIAGFAVLTSLWTTAMQRRPSSQRQAGATWKIGDTVDVELTLIANDKAELACASQTEVAKKHCQFEAPNRRWAIAGSSFDDAFVLKPYMTVNDQQLLAAGVWSQPALADPLPVTRFTVKCKFSIESSIRKPHIRWKSDQSFAEQNNNWFAGSVSDCNITSKQ